MAVVAVVVLGLFEALLLAPLMFDGRLETVFGTEFPEATLDSVVLALGSLLAVFSFSTGAGSFWGTGVSSLLATFGSDVVGGGCSD